MSSEHPNFYNNPMMFHHHQQQQQQQHTSACPPDPSPYLFYYYQHPYGPDYASQDNAPKRQRRQTAGAFIQNIFALNGGGKKRVSTAQPRPVITVPPGGIGPVCELNQNDVLSGRGGRINAHPGNVQFRAMVLKRKEKYLAKTTKKLAKAHIAAEIVRHIRSMNPPGRFLKQEADGSWWDIGDAKAIKKVGQALREDGPDVRNDSKDNKNDKGTQNRSGLGKPQNSTEMSSETPLVEKSATVPSHESKTNVSKRTTSTMSKGSSSSARQNIFQQRVLPPPTPTRSKQYQFPLGGRGGGVSGAAAEAMEDSLQLSPAPCDEAFGMPFYPPPPRVDINRGTSMVSGLSGPSVMSGVSNISGISDPASSSLVGHKKPMTVASSMKSSIILTGERRLNLESSLNADTDNARSMAGSSLLGASTDDTSESIHSGMTPIPIHDTASVASMSIVSDSLLSMPASIVASDLSESLLALDLADPK